MDKPRISIFVATVGLVLLICLIAMVALAEGRATLTFAANALSHGAHFQYPSHSIRWRLLVQCSERGLRLGRRQIPHPTKVAHQSVSSMMLMDGVPASLLIVETRWPREQRRTCTQFGGSSVPCGTRACRARPAECQGAFYSGCQVGT